MKKNNEIKLEGLTAAAPKQALQDVLIFLILAGAFCTIDVLLKSPALYSGLISVIGAFVSVYGIQMLRKQSIKSLGLWRPKRPWTLPFWMIGIFVVSIIVAGGAQLLIKQFVDVSVDLSKFAVLHQNLPMLFFGLVSVWVTAAFFEEIVFRGFLLGRLCDLFGSSFPAVTLALILHAVLFGILHAYQGLLGIIGTGVVALVFGFFFRGVRIVETQKEFALIASRVVII